MHDERQPRRLLVGASFALCGVLAALAATNLANGNIFTAVLFIALAFGAWERRPLLAPPDHHIARFGSRLRGAPRFVVWMLFAIGLVWVVTTGAFVLAMPSTLSSGPARFFRHLSGEPGATQDVNDTAEVLAGPAGHELESFAANTMRVYASNAMTLPEAAFDDGRAVPIERLPKAFWTIGGTWRSPPQVVLRLDATRRPTEVRLKWGNAFLSPSRPGVGLRAQGRWGGPEAREALGVEMGV